MVTTALITCTVVFVFITFINRHWLNGISFLEMMPLYQCQLMEMMKAKTAILLICDDEFHKNLKETRLIAPIFIFIFRFFIFFKILLSYPMNTRRTKRQNLDSIGLERDKSRSNSKLYECGICEDVQFLSEMRICWYCRNYRCLNCTIKKEEQFKITWDCIRILFIARYKNSSCGFYKATLPTDVFKLILKLCNWINERVMCRDICYI